MKKLLFITTALVAAADPAHAGPVAAAVAWVGSALAAGGIAAAALQIVGSLALNAIAGALMKQKAGTAGASVSFDVQFGDDLPLSFTVGDYATAGRRKYIGSWGTNTRFITEVIEVSALPQGLAGLWVDDEPGEFVAGRRGYVSAAAAPGSVGRVDEAASVPVGQIDLGTPLENNRDNADSTDPRIWVKWVDGTQAAADPLLVWAFGSDADYPWTADMVGRGKSYAIVTCQYDHDTQTSYPTILWEPQPLRLYDLRFDSTAGGSGSQRWNNPATWQPTRNPAVIAYNIARGIHYGSEWIFGGRNLPAWRLPAAEWIAAANACDDTVNLSGGGTEPRYRCGMEISVDMEPAAVLEELGKAANMHFAEVGGRLKPTVDLPGAAVFSFTDGDILITEGQSFSPFYPVSETFNAVGATYPERGEKWASKDASEYIDEDAQAEDGQYLPTSMTYGAVPFGRQVRRLMRAQMRDFRRMRRHQFFLSPDAYALEPGDMVSWTSARNGYNNKLFMVESVAKTPGMNVLVSLREVDPGDYDWSSSWQVPVIITAPKNPKPFVQPINGLIVEPASLLDANGTARQPAIRVRCDGDELGVTDIHIQARLPGQDVTIDTTRRFAEPWRWYLRGVLADTDYQVRARLLSDLTPKSVWSSWISVRTHDVRLGSLDIRYEQIKDEVRESVEDLYDFASGTGDYLREILAELAALRDGILEVDFSTYTLHETARREMSVSLGAARSEFTEQIDIAVTETEAVAQLVTTLKVEVGQNNASVQQQLQAFADLQSAQSVAITSLNSALGDKANASAVTALTTRVTNAEGTITSQSVAITSLNSALGDKADASAVTALTTRVTNAEGAITSHADAINRVETKVGRSWAAGTFRVRATATPSGAVSRIALLAEAGEGTDSQNAGLYLEARSNGDNQVLIQADRFAVVQNGVPGEPKQVPFVIDDGIVYLDNPLVAPNSISRMISVSTANVVDPGHGHGKWTYQWPNNAVPSGQPAFTENRSGYVDYLTAQIEAPTLYDLYFWISITAGDVVANVFRNANSAPYGGNSYRAVLDSHTEHSYNSGALVGVVPSVTGPQGLTVAFAGIYGSTWTRVANCAITLMAIMK